MSQAEGVQDAKVYLPSEATVAAAAVSGMAAYEELCAQAEADYEGFWAGHARELLTWKTPFTKVLNEENSPFFKAWPAICFGTRWPLAISRFSSSV